MGNGPKMSIPHISNEIGELMDVNISGGCLTMRGMFLASFTLPGEVTCFVVACLASRTPIGLSCVPGICLLKCYPHILSCISLKSELGMSSGLKHLRYGIKYDFLYSAPWMRAYLSARTWSFRASVVSLGSHPDSRCDLMGSIQQASCVTGATSSALMLGALNTSK